MNVDALDFFGFLIQLLWILLAIAVGVLVTAGIAVAGRIVSTRLEGRYLPRLARWSRRRAGLTEEAGPWACAVCHSVNPSTAVRCYHCGVPRPVKAVELAEAATDPSVFHRPPSASRFDPSLYRGPGAPAAPTADDQPPGPLAPEASTGAPPPPGAEPAAGAPPATGAPPAPGADPPPEA